MGFDQYHEPPQELPEETRTFARLCASLTEEAEAIGWYEQRLAVERDPEARAVMADAVGEEYKHFCMDLEFLLRRKPKWREIAEGVLLQDGDIVEHGEAAEAAAGRRLNGAALTPSRVRSPVRWLSEASRRDDEPSTARARADHRGRLARIDEEARERLLPGLAASRLVDFTGPHGWEHSATNLGRVEDVDVSPVKGVEANRRVVLPLVELRARFTVSREELRAGDRGAEDIDFDALDVAAQSIVEAENLAVFHAWPKAGIDGIGECSPHDAINRRGRRREVSRARRPRRGAAAAQRDRRTVRTGAGPRGIHARGRERRARRLPAARSPAQDPQGPDRVGAGREGSDRVEHAWR